MQADIKTKWVEALRSKNYTQGRRRLRSDNTYCCLGVLCDVIDPKGWTGLDEFKYKDNIGVTNLPTILLMELSLVNESWVFIEMNDNEGRSFSYIADYVENNL